MGRNVSDSNVVPFIAGGDGFRSRKLESSDFFWSNG